MSRRRARSAPCLAALLMALLPGAAFGQGTWAPTGDMTAARSFQAAAFLPDGRVLAIAGQNGSGALTTTEVWDPSNGIWSAGGPLAQIRRGGHTATVLLDGRVLVVGGTNPVNGNAVKSVELWDPATLAWSTGTDLSVARANHSATLLADGRVLVAGGDDGGVGYHDSAVLWDPASGGWTATGSFAVRSDHTASRLPDGRVVVTGGYDGSAYLASAQVWSPADGAWSSAGSMTTARYLHTATVLPDGRVWVAGGRNGASPALDSAELLDPATNVWGLAATLPTAREYHRATLLPDGRMLVSGGRDAAGVTLASADLWDPPADAWSPGGTMATPRFGHIAALLPDGRVLAAGGRDGSGGSGTHFAGAEVWDPGASSWSPAGTLATGRRYPSATVLAMGGVLIAGGTLGDGSTFYNSAEVWDPATVTWTVTSSMATARSEHSAVLIEDGRVMVTGGVNGGGPVGTAEMWDPVTGTWVSSGNLATARGQHAATLLADGRVLLSGGNNGGAIADAEIGDPGAGTWTALTPMITARRLHAAVLLPDGRVMVAGGRTGSSTVTGDVEIWDPATANWTASGALATGRADFGLVVLSDHRVLAVGGYTGGLNSTTATAEVWDARTGQWTSAGSLASKRMLLSIDVLPDGRVLVAGGLSGLSYLATIEVWDPATGVWSPGADLLAGRGAHASTVLPDGRVLVAGGATADSNADNRAEVWQSGPAIQSVLEPCRPGLGQVGTNMPAGPWPSGSTVKAFGARLRGCSEGSYGGNPGNAPGNAPLIRFLSLSNGSVWDGRYTRSRHWTDQEVTFTVPGDAGLAPGHYAVQAVVNGIPSLPEVVRITRTHQKYYLHQERTGDVDTRDLRTQSPLFSGDGHLPQDKNVQMCRGLGAVGEFHLTTKCGTTTDIGKYVYPPADGFVEPRAVSGSWTLRGDVKGVQGTPGGTAFLFARIKRHSDGCLIHETERYSRLELANLSDTVWTEAILHAVVPPRPESCPATCDPAVPCASTVIPAGDRMRLEWWIDVVTADPDGDRIVQMAIESPGSSAASFAVLSDELLVPPGPTGAPEHLSGFRGTGLPGAVRLSWETLDELEAAGFDLYRSSEGPEGPFERVNPELIPAQGALGGAAYEYVDQGLPEGAAPWYSVHLLGAGGTRLDSQGPIQVPVGGDERNGMVCACRLTRSGETTLGASMLVLLLGALHAVKRHRARGSL